MATKKKTELTKDELVRKGIFFKEHKRVPLFPPGDDEYFFDSKLCKKIDRALNRISDAMEEDSDALKATRRLLETYGGNDYPDFDPDLPRDVLIRVVINNVLVAICGWSLPTLMADKFPGDENLTRGKTSKRRTNGQTNQIRARNRRSRARGPHLLGP